MSRFGEILAELRKDKGLSQKELAMVFHVSSSTISSYETGSHLPNSEQIVAFADYFDVTTDYLLGRSSCDMSPEILTKPFSCKLCIQDVINMLEAFPPEHRQAFALLLEEISLGLTMRVQANQRGR